jgi:hypothetical protein
MSGTRDHDVKVDPLTGQPYVEIGGLRAFIGTEAECAAAEFVVCGWHSYFPDDIWTTCARCGRAICHRPYIPTTPPKICAECLAIELEHGKATP